MSTHQTIHLLLYFQYRKYDVGDGLFFYSTVERTKIYPWWSVHAIDLFMADAMEKIAIFIKLELLQPLEDERHDGGMGRRCFLLAK